MTLLSKIKSMFTRKKLVETPAIPHRHLEARVPIPAHHIQYYNPPPPHSPTVAAPYKESKSSDDGMGFVTGLIVGEMLSGPSPSYDSSPSSDYASSSCDIGSSDYASGSDFTSGSCSSDFSSSFDGGSSGGAGGGDSW